MSRTNVREFKEEKSMQLIILLVVMSVLGAFTIKCMKNEDAIIELEDKIIADIRDFFRSEKKSEEEPEAIRPRVIKRTEAGSNRAA